MEEGLSTGLGRGTCWINSQCLAIPNSKEGLASWCPAGEIRSGTVGSTVKMDMRQACCSP